MHRPDAPSSTASVPGPRVPGTSRWQVVFACPRAGVLAIVLLGLFGSVAWPEDHVLSAEFCTVISNAQPIGDPPPFSERVFERPEAHETCCRYRGPVIRLDGADVLVNRIESLFAAGAVK